MKIVLIIVKLLFVFNIFFGCSPDDLLDPISFKVTASGAGFDGYYIADNGATKNFEGSLLVGGFSTYEKKVEIEENLEVYLTTRSGVSSVSVKIYRNDRIVKKVEKENLSEPENVSLDYIYNDETNPQKETTTTTTTTTNLTTFN